MKKVQTEDGVTHLQWVTKPEDAIIYDECFWVRQQRCGTYVSVGIDDREFVTAQTEEGCVSGTRFYLKGKQDGWDDTGVIRHSGTVGGKL